MVLMGMYSLVYKSRITSAEDHAELFQTLLLNGIVFAMICVSFLREGPRIYKGYFEVLEKLEDLRKSDPESIKSVTTFCGFEFVELNQPLLSRRYSFSELISLPDESPRCNAIFHSWFATFTSC